MSKETLIRRAVQADLPGIIDIYNQSVLNGNVTGDTEPVDYKSQLDWFSDHRPDKNPVYVATIDNRVVAYNALSLYRFGRPAFRHALETSYYVDKCFQRKGVASKLLDFVIAECRYLGVDILLTYVLEQNTASISFLKKYGFEKWGELPGVAKFHGKRYDHRIYGRKISKAQKSL